MGHPHLSRLALRRRQLIGGFIALTGIALGLASSGGVAQARSLDDVRATGTLRVTVYRANPPFSYVDDQGKLTGIDVDLAAALAKGLGVKVEYFPIRDGDDISDDLRNGVWRGSVVGDAPGDVMMHVPYDKQLEVSNDLVRLFAPYDVDRLALAVDPDKAKQAEDFSLFEERKVGVDVGTLADMILVSAREKKLLNNVRHFRGTAKAYAAFERGEVDAVYGMRSEIEPLSKKSTRPVTLIAPAHRLARDWAVGLAVRVNATDLGYALADQIDQLRKSGELAQIFARYDVTLATPARPE